MFIHWFAGAVIFLIGGNLLDLEVNRLFIFLGAIFGALPDLFSLRLKTDRWSHEHRNNFFHSLFFPFLVFIILLILFGWKMPVLALLAMLSHPILDLYGPLGWGVKLFYPLDKKSYKLFHGGKKLYVFEVGEVRKKLQEKGHDNWFKDLFFTVNFFSLLEGGFLLLLILMLIFVE